MEMAKGYLDLFYESLIWGALVLLFVLSWYYFSNKKKDKSYWEQFLNGLFGVIYVFLFIFAQEGISYAYYRYWCASYGVETISDPERFEKHRDFIRYKRDQKLDEAALASYQERYPFIADILATADVYEVEISDDNMILFYLKKFKPLGGEFVFKLVDLTDGSIIYERRDYNGTGGLLSRLINHRGDFRPMPYGFCKTNGFGAYRNWNPDGTR
ncbi:MAG: hypothetical protein LBU87_01625 [Lactobacillales bacterium]|jgi:hypothetical protein|nr:hypothetical protein [Lactobacillales bacterium]